MEGRYRAIIEKLGSVSGPYYFRRKRFTFLTDFYERTEISDDPLLDSARPVYSPHIMAVHDRRIGAVASVVLFAVLTVLRRQLRIMKIMNTEDFE